MTRAAPFHQVDLARALKAAAMAGERVQAAEIDNSTGKIRLIFVDVTVESSALDGWKAGRGKR
jgi:hypothetical protein